MTTRLEAAMGAAALCVLASGCGGSGQSLAMSPPAPATPVAPLPAKVNDTSVELVAPPAAPALAVATRAEPIAIRYDQGRALYEVQFGTYGWSAVIDPPDPHDPAIYGPNRYFQVAGVPSAWIALGAHHRSSNAETNYTYSNIATWSAEGIGGGPWGNMVAFGVPTSAGDVPISGTGAFEGLVRGIADVPNGGWGDTATTPLDGQVKLAFDFGAGTLAGGMRLASACDCTTNFDLGTIAFASTAFARGATTFSGTFATGASGTNAFAGQFTGPGARELIASWALPFVLNGTSHQATGAWIAKRGD
ncbi:hypothetical protein B0I00_2070 [Novosphingobium kunmingense]|uniref:Transferrin-binding protein B C-lobe/N-lobe beta barrel domain-containing protein n=1 Tax=Novosphingobium kunmingense TaxID=1211806 RepID=A0A2N0H6E5_9SPHN|nr:hypothetical protein [Novosphingobium kunmingense]PKB14480.1 hypothetical protein B0I00_2070 [Novosphingobium kunmingense]